MQARPPQTPGVFVIRSVTVAMIAPLQLDRACLKPTVESSVFGRTTTAVWGDPLRKLWLNPLRPAMIAQSPKMLWCTGSAQATFNSTTYRAQARGSDETTAHNWFCLGPNPRNGGRGLLHVFHGNARLLRCRG